MSLPLPQALVNLIDSGFWPSTSEKSSKQDSKPLVGPDKLKSFISEGESIYFYPPSSFHTVGSQQRLGDFFWGYAWPITTELDANKILLIGDFGHGADAPLALNYCQDSADPSVIRLHWTTNRSQEPMMTSTWIEIAPSFEAFVRMILD